MILSVTGGKGGVGKSMVSLNLSRELGALVVDGDLSTADLPHGTGPDLHDVLAGRVDPTEAVEQFWMMSLLPCGRTIEGARAANLENLPKALEVLEREYGWVVVDSPAGLARDVGIQLQHADAAVLVTNPDEAALENAKQARDLARKLETPIAAIVLNKAQGTVSQDALDELEATMGASVVPIPQHPAIEAAQEDWVPIHDTQEGDDLVEKFEELAGIVEQTKRHVEGRITA